MNVIVAKKNHPKYIGLSNTGQFVKFRHNAELQIGEMADVKPSTLRIAPRLVAGLAAAMILTSASVLGYAYYVPANYLYVDINPSIELGVNCFDRVISAKGLNSDGEQVISETSLNNNSTEKSVEKIIEKAIEKGYMREDLENVIFLNSSGDAKVLEKIKEKVNNYTNSGALKNIHPDVQFDNVDNAEVQEAQKQHISAGKLKLIKKATLINPELSKEQLVDMPVREIIKRIKEDRAEQKEIKKSTDTKTEKPIIEKRSINKASSTDNTEVQGTAGQDDTKKITPQADKQAPPQAKAKNIPQIREKDTSQIRNNSTVKLNKSENNQVAVKKRRLFLDILGVPPKN